MCDLNADLLCFNMDISVIGKMPNSTFQAMSSI